MEGVASFTEVLEAADQLPLDDQEALADVLRRRIVEHRREELAAEIQQAQQEFEQGRCRRRLCIPALPVQADRRQ